MLEHIAIFLGHSPTSSYSCLCRSLSCNHVTITIIISSLRSLIHLIFTPFIHLSAPSIPAKLAPELHPLRHLLNNGFNWALNSPAMALKTPQTSSEGAEHRPKVGGEGDIAKLRFILLSLLQNTHPGGTSIDEVLTDARRVMGQRSIVGESSTVPLPSSTPTAIRRQLEQLLDLQPPKTSSLVNLRPQRRRPQHTFRDRKPTKMTARSSNLQKTLPLSKESV